MAGTASTNSAPRASLPGLPGFKNPVFDTQRIFRRLMRTMSLPGTVVTIDGIDLPQPTWDEIGEVATELGVEVPQI